MTEPTTNPVNLPREIGGYRIQRVLGSGGMATVYAALQTQPRRTVALKVMKPGVSMARGDAAHRRFTREIEILGKLRHPFIAQVYGAGTHDDGSGATPYFVMEYVPGAKTITEFIAEKQLDVRERLKLFVKVCAAIEHGHRRKIIHRDLKPANILIDENGDPKIIDFGVAHAAELDITSQTMHTEAGRLVGTLQYMSPEQLDATLQDLDARCDVYALGVLLYKLLTGKPPHDLEALPVYEAVRIIREESPRHPSEVKPEVFRGNLGGRGDDLETIILKSMEPDRTRRYRNAGSLGRDIVRFLADKPINARRASVLYRAGLFVRRHRVAVIAGATVTFVVLLAAAFVINERMNRPSQSNISTAANPAPAPPVITSSDSTTPAKPTGPITLSQHTGTITRLAFSPDGLRLVSAAFDRSIVIWDVTTQQAVAFLADMNTAVRHAAFSADGRRLLIAGSDDTAYLLDLSNIGQQPLRLNGPETTSIRVRGGSIRSIAINATGNRIAIGLEDFTLRLFAIADGKSQPSQTLRSTSGAFTSIAFNADELKIAAGTHRGVVHAWNVELGSALSRFIELQEPIIAFGFAAILQPVTQTETTTAAQTVEGLIAIAADGSAMRWRLLPANDPPLRPFTAGPSPVVDASIDPSGRWLAVAAANEVQIRDLSQAALDHAAFTLKNEEPIFAVAIDPAGRWCAIGLASGEVKLLPIR